MADPSTKQSRVVANTPPLLTSSSPPEKTRAGRRLLLIPGSKSHVYEWFTPGVEGSMQMSTKEVVSSIVLWPMEKKLHLSCAIGCTKKRDQNGALSASFHTRGRCVSFYNILWGLSWLLKENMPVSWEPVKASWNQNDFSLGWAGLSHWMWRSLSCTIRQALSPSVH